MVGIDITGKRFGYLTAVQLSERENKNVVGSRRKWRCICDCGNETIVEQRLLTTQRHGIRSCGCIREKAHLLVTSKCPWLTMEYLWSFKDWDKFAFLHKSLIKLMKFDTLSEKYYKDFINKFYNQKQFNFIYSQWLNNNKTSRTFYDLYKPSIDHILPKSKGGTNDLDNLQFLTVFENLCKRDMTAEEWILFKKENNIKGDIFLEGVVL